MLCVGTPYERIADRVIAKELKQMKKMHRQKRKTHSKKTIKGRRFIES